MYLNCHSYYSLKYGTDSPEKLVAKASGSGHTHIALTDINNTSAAYPFIRACEKHGITPVLGIEFREGNKLRFVGVARNQKGWHELCKLLTHHSVHDIKIPAIAPELSDVFIIYRRAPLPVADLRSYEFIGIDTEDIPRLYGSELLQYPDKLLAFCNSTFANKEDYHTHRLLRCIDKNIIISKLEDSDCSPPSAYMRSPAELKEMYANYPFLIERTQKLLKACNFSLKTGMKNNRISFTVDRENDMKLLSKLAHSGCNKRYGTDNRHAFSRMKKELKVIKKMDYASYFLITWDIVRYAHVSGYHHVGRGSGANSLVAYCIGITDVDPLELDLYFERFINPHRTSPPDFDIDFSWDERDEVTDYIFKRYGADHTALLATYNTFKGRSIIRELGKVLGLPKADIDLIVKQPNAEEKHHHYAKYIFRYGKKIEGMPNYLSIHAGGVLISEKPLYNHTALQMMPKGFPITHFDMYTAEDMGFHKYDVLSQRGLGHIKDAIEIIHENQGRAVNVHRIQQIKEDQKVKAHLKSGNCIGCFYIESPAMRGLLSKLSCDNYTHLVAASSIIRPGVAKSGMMREYIKRFHKPEEIEYLHPVFAEELGETFGIMVYQEDVMKIVHHFAGLDLDESDVLRRIMSGKKKTGDTFQRLRQKFFRNCKKRGHSPALSKEVWRQVESFSGYSFCKAHSASFAVESFQSLYLKTYFPLEFMVAVINNFGGFYNTELYVHEARMNGGVIKAPCVNHSRFLTHIYDRTIYLGFIHIKELEKKVAHRIVKNRDQKGEYKSLEEFVHRVEISGDQLEILIRIGAFEFTGMNKYELMWEKNAVYSGQVSCVTQESLFDFRAERYPLPNLTETEHEQAFDEIELLGFPLCSPFDLLENEVTGDIPAEEMINYCGRVVTMLGYYITRKPVTTVNGKHMAFGTWWDRKGKFFDTTHFPDCLSNYPLLGKGIYEIKGKIVEDFGFPSMNVISMKKLPYVKDKRY